MDYTPENIYSLTSSRRIKQLVKDLNPGYE